MLPGAAEISEAGATFFLSSIFGKNSSEACFVKGILLTFACLRQKPVGHLFVPSQDRHLQTSVFMAAGQSLMHK